MSRYKTDDSSIVEADRDQIAMLAGGTGRVCGQCKHFAYEEGQRTIQATRFLEMVVREHGWKLSHLGAQPQDLAICGEHMGGDSNQKLMVVGRFSSAITCPGFRPANGHLSLARRDHE